jgi:hypothetical protein
VSRSADDVATGPDPVELDGACTTGGSCDDCVFGCHDAAAARAPACGNGGGTSAARERLVLAASGTVMTLLAATVVATGGGVLHLILGGAGVVAGLVLAVVGGIAAVRGGPRGDRLRDLGAGLLPYATALLLVGLLARLVAAIADIIRS